MTITAAGLIWSLRSPAGFVPTKYRSESVIRMYTYENKIENIRVVLKGL